MKNRTSSRTGLFLMELILAVLFFSLSGAICIQLFVQSHVVSENSVDLNHGVLWTQNVAEAFYGCNGNAEEMAALFTNCIHETQNDGSDYLTLLFDGEFQPLSSVPSSLDDAESEQYSYQLSATISSAQNGLVTCHIQVNELTKKDSIYELTITLFQNKEAANE